MTARKQTTQLQKVGNRIMLPVPAPFVKRLKFRTGRRVKMIVRNGILEVAPMDRPIYTIEELLKKCKPRPRISKEDREWLNAPRVGRELL